MPIQGHIQKFPESLTKYTLYLCYWTSLSEFKQWIQHFTTARGTQGTQVRQSSIVPKF